MICRTGKSARKAAFHPKFGEWTPESGAFPQGSPEAHTFWIRSQGFVPNTSRGFSVRKLPWPQRSRSSRSSSSGKRSCCGNTATVAVGVAAAAKSHDGSRPGHRCRSNRRVRSRSSTSSSTSSASNFPFES